MERGPPADRLSQVKGRKHDLTSEREELAKAIEEWIDANGEDLACGLEVLERDHDVLTAPTRVAVSDHAFVIDGWIEMRRSDEVTKALEPFCLYTESDQFELIAGGGEVMATQTTTTIRRCLRYPIRREPQANRWNYLQMLSEGPPTEEWIQRSS